MNDHPICTYIGALIGLIITVIGGIAVLTDSLTFAQYLDELTGFMVGMGLVAVGRGIRLHGTPKGE